MPGGEEYDYSSYENTAIFYSSMYQYIIMAIVFSRGKPYRNRFYTNCKYFFFIICLFEANNAVFLPISLSSKLFGSSTSMVLYSYENRQIKTKSMKKGTISRTGLEYIVFTSVHQLNI